MKQYLKIETLIHGIMITFAIASTTNIAYYMLNSHNPITSWAIAVSLGFGLVAVAIILSKVDTGNKSLFFKLLIATLSICALSGTLQLLAYHSHGLSLALSALFGYGFPLVAEVILALAISAYDLNNHQLKIKSANTMLRDKSAIVLADTIARYDPQHIQSYIDEQITGLVKQEVNQVLNEIFPKRDNKPVPKKEILKEPEIQLLPESIEEPINIELPDRLKPFYEYLTNNYNGVETDKLNISEISKGFGVSWPTAKGYVTTLQEKGVINGFVK